LGLLAASVAVIQFVSEAALPGARYTLGLALAVLATLTAVLGWLRWRQVDKAMRRGEALPRYLSPAYLAIGLGVIGLLVIGAVIFRAVSG
jgi:putative membrane protein